MTTERPDWDLWFMRQAYVVAQRGSCKRLQVGAIVVRDRDHKQVGTGYNGAPAGEAHCLDVGCDEVMIDGKLSCVRTLHAESNALDDITTGGRLAEPHTLYCTVIPCLRCAQRIIQRGITRVVYHQYYESQGTKHVERLLTCYIPVIPRGERCVVNLRRLDVPDWQVKPTYEPDDSAPKRSPAWTRSQER